VYNKLTQEGYPADKIKREAICRQLNIAQWPSELVSSSKNQCIRRALRPDLNSNYPVAESSSNVPYTICSNSIEEQTEPPFGESPNFPQHASVASASNTPPENSGQTPAHSTYDFDISEQPKWAATQDDNYDQFVDMDMTLFGMDFQDVTLPPSQETHLDMSDEACDVSPRASLSHTHVYRHSPESSQESEGALEYCESQQASGAKLQGHLPNMPTPVDVPDLVDTPSPFSTNAFPATPRNHSAAVTGYSKPRPVDRWNPKFGAPKSINPDRNSSSTFDSGYGSGRSSPFSFQAVERPSRRTVPASAPPFNGLHRVPCKGFHEPRKYNAFYKPQPTGRYREVDTCRKCKYSAIHNLSWSAQYLKYEVFETELKLPETYKVTALDAAGNSALHYAAIGGAGLEVIAILIEYGVDPCQINTSGELFLHCMRPHFEQSNPGFEKCLFPAFRTNLVNLLNDLDPKYNGLFRWRDNTGTAALERFVSNISDNDIKSRIRE
jgi:ankyrin repeat protein